MNATYIQKPVSFPSVRPLSSRMVLVSFWSHGARTYPEPPRMLAESLTHQPASSISSHCLLLKPVTCARRDVVTALPCDGAFADWLVESAPDVIVLFLLRDDM